MKQQFNIILTNRWKATGLVIGGVGLLVLVAAATVGAVERYSPVAAGLLGIGLLFGWIFWFIPRAAQKFCTELATAILDEDGLTVHYPATGATRRVRLAALLGWEGWQMFQAIARKGAWGRFLFLGLLFAAYALAWWHPRKQSN